MEKTAAGAIPPRFFYVGYGNRINVVAVARVASESAPPATYGGHSVPTRLRAYPCTLCGECSLAKHEMDTAIEQMS